MQNFNLFPFRCGFFVRQFDFMVFFILLNDTCNLIDYFRFAFIFSHNRWVIIKLTSLYVELKVHHWIKYQLLQTNFISNIELMKITYVQHSIQFIVRSTHIATTNKPKSSVIVDQAYVVIIKYIASIYVNSNVTFWPRFA